MRQFRATFLLLIGGIVAIALTGVSQRAAAVEVNTPKVASPKVIPPKVNVPSTPKLRAKDTIDWGDGTHARPSATNQSTLNPQPLPPVHDPNPGGGSGGDSQKVR